MARDWQGFLDHDVALVVTARREPNPGGQRALVNEDHVTEEERTQHLQGRNSTSGILN